MCALIPAYLLLAAGVMFGLIGRGVLGGVLIPPYVLLAIASPFFAVYARDPAEPWLRTPRGIVTVLGFPFLFAEVFQSVQVHPDDGGARHQERRH